MRFSVILRQHFFPLTCHTQVDVPDSGDYTDFVREELEAEGIPPGNIFPISAATGQGVLDLVRWVS